MRQSKRIIKQFQFSEASTDELNDLLENGFYKQQKLTKPEVPKSEPIPKETRAIFNVIEEMRKGKNAPVDLLGPQTCFDKSKDVETQRFQILSCLMLSPQTKDEATSKCSKRLMNYSINDIANMKTSELTKLVYEVNFNATKAKRIQELAQVALYKGMPQTFDETLKIKGVGEKIALLYIQFAFQRVEGIAVDVNMIRICNRIPITKEQSPTRIRKFLESQFEKDDWGKINEILVGFGQQVCLPKPKCEQCALNKICDYYQNNIIK